MADHWKSIANRLGAPGMDEPETENQGNDPEMDAGQASPSSRPERGSGPRGQRPEARREESSEPPADKPPADKPPADKPPVDKPVAEKPAAERRPPARSAPERSQPPAASPPADPPPPPAAPKRKSSWESLASMFNIKVERTPEQPATPEISDESLGFRSEEEGEPDRDDSTPDKASLSLFSAETEDDSNPALKAMFADAPREPADWNAPRKVVDDLGWDDAEDTPTETPPQTHGSLEDEPADDEEEQPRRGRRRRRRGRRGRGDGEATAQDTESSEVSWKGEEVDEAESPELLSDASDDWQEPESFESGSGDEEEASEGEVVRRSNRRRRGRGRDRAVDRDEAPRPERPSRRPAPASEASPQAISSAEDLDLDEDAPQDELLSSDSPSRSSHERGSDERGRGGRRRRRGKSSEDRPERRPSSVHFQDSEPADAEPVEGEPFADDDDEDQALESSKHRNIPTWTDSIQSLVEANMQNRKRGDNNRGGPRGRPRGRR